MVKILYWYLKKNFTGRAWAYKWLKRFDNEGVEGLKDRPRSGRPPDVPEEKLSKIRRELSENPSGWKAKEIMNIIHKKAGVRYHKFMSIGYYTSGVSNLKYHKGDLSIRHQRKRRNSSKKS